MMPVAPPSGTAPPPNPQKVAMEKIFKNVSGDDMEVDWMELKQILDHTMKDGNVISFFVCKN